MGLYASVPENEVKKRCSALQNAPASDNLGMGQLGWSIAVYGVPITLK